MKRCSLFTAVEEVVTVYNEYLPYIKVMKLIPDSNEYINKDELVKTEIEHLEIHRICEGTKRGVKESYVAFEPKLQKVIDMFIYQRTERQRLTNKLLAEDNQRLIGYVNDLEALSFWSFIKLKAKRMFT